MGFGLVLGLGQPAHSQTRFAAGTPTKPLSVRDGEAAPEVRHLASTSDGWAVAETGHFRIYHNQTRAFVERMARAAEQARTAVFQKWFGDAGTDWKPACRVYLHATASDYCQATGAPLTSPGHSNLRTEGSRVLSRRIDLSCEAANLLEAVLPHEVTHVVLPGQFGERQVPRWADEGVAILSEPREQIERHLRTLARQNQEQQLFTVRHLLQLPDYPDVRSLRTFYAQSVSLVGFLADAQGPQTFTRFMRDGMRIGYETACKRHYGWDFDELNEHWRRHAFGKEASSGLASRGR